MTKTIGIDIGVAGALALLAVAGLLRKGGAP
jgi:hypothetical protein